MTLPTTPENPSPSAAPDRGFAELVPIMDRLSVKYPRIQGYLTADARGEIGQCRFDAGIGGEGERSLHIYLRPRGGFIAVCVSGLDPIPGMLQALSPLLAD